MLIELLGTWTGGPPLTLGAVITSAALIASPAAKSSEVRIRMHKEVAARRAAYKQRALRHHRWPHSLPGRCQGQRVRNKSIQTSFACKPGDRIGFNDAV
mmetsp:Transcript_99036/g.288855  ORF Transcript_99036/g.288855 Transcript_99036/m.288855 type:complete len:99 (+) Transcript_99036:281-577(+)